ncbi:hypothetical protein [Rickettsia endosymbiont of Ceutorhynchus obstrictus]|uniref:hypothetical protein n=1 Tax=Rickettsia endosymbiont of Ceutorhynchus obstrictus TaxID=3066249 RepID=UPI003132F166
MDANGAASPFADSNAVPADTYYINNIDFANGAGALNISDPTITNSIKLNANTYSTTLENAAAATLNVNSGLTVRDITWATLKTINIANGVKYEYITNDANDIDVQPTLNQLIFKGANSAVNFSNENINSNKFVATEGIVSGADDQGIVSFHVSTSATEISANVGTNAKRLQAFITDGLNITTITGNIFAKKIEIAQNPDGTKVAIGDTQLIWTTPINTGAGGLVQFTTNSISQFQDDITSNMDFNGTDATAILDNDVDVTGNIINSVAGGTGTINFADNSTVTGNVGGLNGIGGNTTGSYPVGVFNIQGDNATTVDLQGNVTVNNFNFTSNGIASIGGTLTATAGVNYNNAAGTLQFNGAAGPYTFNSPIVNGNNGTLDVFTNLLATNANIGTLATINIGNNIGGNGSLTVTVPGNVAFNSPININTAVSQLIIAPGAAQTFTFGNNVTNTTGGQGGSVTFNGTGGALVVAGNKTIGAGNILDAINIIGGVIAQPGLNLAGTAALNMKAGSIFQDNSLSTTNVAAINIGEAGVPANAATYALDAKNAVGGAFNLNAGGIKFPNAASVLQLQSSAPAGSDTTINLNGNLDPGAAGSGIVAITAINTGETLKIAGAGTLGIVGPGNTLNSITFAGAGNITVVPTINTANAISTGITGALTLGNVNAGINFTAATNLTVNNVTGNIDFKGQTAAALNLTANSTINGTVDSTVGVGGKLNLAANTTVTGVIGTTNALTAVNFNGADINLTAASDANLFTVSGGATATAGGLMTGAVNYAGAGTLTVQNGIKGAVTSTAGGNEILTIDGGNVTGTIGVGGAINLVNIGANPVIFGASVFANTVALTDNASALTLGNNVALTGVVTTANANNGILTFNPGSSVSGTIGGVGAALAQVDILGAAAFGANVWANAVQLTDGLSVLTLNNATVNGAITNTSGNNNSGILILNPGSSVNGIIGANAAALAAVNIGAGAASFGEDVFSKVVALTNGLSVLTLNNGVTVNGAITTAANNNGSLTFTGNSSVTGTIGANGAALNTVTFDGVTTLAQPSFSQTFTVNNGANVTSAAAAVINGNVTIMGNGILNASAADAGVVGNVAAGSGQFTGPVDGNGSVAGGTFKGNVTGSATIAGGVFTGNANSVVISGGQFIGDVVTTVNFTGVGTVDTTNVGGTIDFGGSDGTVTVNDTGTLATVTSNSAAAAGNLAFLGGGTVTGKVSNIGTITVNGVNKIINFQQDVSAASLTFANASTANLQGSLTTGNVDFGVGGGTLEFSGLVGGVNPANYTFDSTVANGNTGILAVNTTLIATNADIGKVKTINIGAGKIFTVDASAGAVNLLQANGSTITFGNANSVFGLTTNTAQTVTFNNSLNGGAGNTGIVNLNGNGNTLTLAGNTGVETLGGANTLAVLNVSGNVTISGAAGTTKLDVSKTTILNLAPASVFTDQSLTSATVGAINIGDNTGFATYALDAVNAPMAPAVPPLLPAGRQFDLTAKVNFANPASILKLQSTAPSGINSIVSLLGDFDPGATGGIVELNSANKGANLIIDDRGFTFGTAAHPLKQLTFSGQGAIAIVAKTFTPEILLNIAEIGLTNVTSNITYAANTQFGVGSITGNMDFANQAGTAIFASAAVEVGGTAQITGNITSTGGPNGTVVFMDNGIIGGTVTNLAMLKAGADGSIVRFNTGGNMSISEIQGIGTGTILFAQATPTDLEGVVNQTGGTAVDLVFPSGGSISGDVGSANNPIGTITAQTGLLILEGKVTGDTAFMIDGATIQFNDDVNIGLERLATPNALRTPVALAVAPIDPDFILNSPNPETNSKPVGSQGAVSIQINGNDVTFTNDVINISNIDFTSPQGVTATFASQNAIVGGATTNANRLHTIAISGDLTTGTLPFGSDSNHLKTVQFNGVDGKITIDSQDFYSSITTKTNNQGSAIFNANNGFTDDLGGENLSLKLVQFSSNKGTVKGDTYAKDITIDVGKSAVFTGYNSRSLDIPAATVGGVKVPRATTKFNYKTKVVSDNFKGSSNSSAEYTNAVLLQAPINGGSHKFDDDVWLQKAVTGTNNITFAPKKTAFIQSDLGASTIVADQATMMFTGDNASVNVGGNISGSNITFDLGNNKIIYTGNAAPTGELTINVLYDTVNSGVENNTDSGNIVIANGANIDLSGVTALKVLLTAASNPASISANSAYPIITSLSGNGITVGNAANLPFNVTANEGVFVRWVINASSFILYPIETTGDITVDNIIKNIITAPPGTDAAKVANVIVNTPIGQRKVVVDHLIPIIERPSITIHKITQINHPFIIPETPIIGPIGGYSPSVPVTGGGVVGVGPNGPAVVGTGPATGGSVIGGTFTPSGPAVVGTGPNGPGTGGVVGVGPNGTVVVGTGPAAGGSVIGGTFTPSGPAVVGTGPNGPGTGGVVGVGPNGPAVVGTGPAAGGSVIGGTFTPSGPAVVGTGPAAGGSVIGGTFTPSGPAVVGTGPNGPGTGGVVGVNPNGPAVVGTGPATGGSVIGGTFTPSGPAVVGTGPNGPGTGGVVGVGPNGPAVVGTGPAAGGSVIGGTFTPSGPAVVGTGPNGPGTGGYSPSAPGGSTGGTSVNGPASVGSSVTPGGSNYTPSIGSGSTSVNGPASVGSSVTPGGSNYTPSIGSGSTSVNGPASVGSSVNPGGSNYTPSIGSGSTSVNGPASVGSSVNPGGSNYTPSIGSGSTSVNGPASVGSSVNPGGSNYTPSIGSGSTSVNGPASVGSSVNPGGSNYTPSIGSGSTSVNGPASVGSSVTPGGSNYTPSIGSGSTSVNGPASVGSSVTPGGSNYTPSIGSGSTSVNGPASVGSSVTPGGSNYTPSIGSGSTSVNGPASVGSSVNPGGSNYTPSIGSGSTSVNGPASVGSSVTPGGSNYTPSIGSGSTSVNGPASVGSSVTPGGSNYTPSIGSGSTSVNGPASVGSSVTPGGSNYTPSIGSGSTSVNGPASVGSSVTPGGSNYTPSIGSGSTSVNGPASVGSSVTPGGSNYTPSIGSGSTSVNGPASVGSSVNPGGSNYTPSIGSGSTSVNGPASVGSSVTPGGSNYTPSIGSGSTSVNGPASVGSSVTPGGSNYTPSIGSGSTSVNGPASVGSSVNPGGSNYTPFGNNVGTSATSPSAATIGSSGNSNIPAASTNSVGSNAVGGSSTNTNNSSAGNSRVGGSSGSNMPIIETGKDSSIGSSGNSSGVSSGAASTGATTTNPNDGFDAARGNTNAGTKEVSDRTSKIRDAENAPDTIPSEQDQGVSRKRGAAVGAGDCDSNEIIYGLWGAPYFGKATQKQQNNLMGYKAKSAGGSIGVDTLINDNIVVGAAYTKVDTKLNYQGAKAGNHTKVNTDMFSAYGLYNFINNWFVEGITSYSRSIIKTNEIRNIINGTETAHGKYRSYSYSGQVVGGYNYLWNETTLSPMFGLRLAKIKDSGYHEFGTSFQNLTIKKRQYNKVEGIAGGEIKTTFYKGEFLIRPQVHAFINYDFKGKTPPIIAELNGLTDPLTVPTPKATKMLYDLGAGVEFKKGRMEYGLHYGLNLAKKYQAQSGTIKIKVNL